MSDMGQVSGSCVLAECLKWMTSERVMMGKKTNRKQRERREGGSERRGGE